MTREQEIKEMAKVKASHITSDKDMQVAFADVLRRGAEWADRTMIDKTCEWLNQNIDNYNIYSEIEWSNLLNDLKQAMKGGEE